MRKIMKQVLKKAEFSQRSVRNNNYILNICYKYIL